MRITAALLTLLLAAPVVAADKPGSDPSQKKVCRKFDPPTGSRMGVKTVCRTGAEWEAARVESLKYQDMRQRLDQVYTATVSQEPR